MSLPWHVEAYANGIDRAARFAAWFAASKVVDAQGRALQMYHGTPTRGCFSNNRYVRAEQWGLEYPPFEVFRTRDNGVTDSGWLGQGAYFTADPLYAAEFGDFLMPVYLRIQRPFEIHDDGTASSANRFRFLQSLQSLSGLPSAFRLNLSVPTIVVGHGIGRESFTRYFRVEQLLNQKWAVLSSSDARFPSGGIVEAIGDSAEEAIFNYRYPYEFRGFLLHLVGDLGAQVFRQLLERNGYDGVIAYREEYSHRGERPGQYIAEALVFEPTQVKSSVGNCGAFDRRDPSILR